MAESSIKNKQCIKILCLAPKLFGGGAESHLYCLLKELAQNTNYEFVVVLTNSNKEKQSSFSNIKVVTLNNEYKSNLPFSKFYQTRRALIKYIQIEKPDIIYSILDKTNILALTLPKEVLLKIRLICSVQNPLSFKFLIYREWRENILTILYRFIYRLRKNYIYALIAPTAGLLNERRSIHHNEKIFYQQIANCTQQISDIDQSTLLSNNIIFIFTLLKQKNFHLSIKIFS